MNMKQQNWEGLHSIIRHVQNLNNFINRYYSLWIAAEVFVMFIIYSSSLEILCCEAGPGVLWDFMTPYMIVVNYAKSYEESIIKQFIIFKIKTFKTQSPVSLGSCLIVRIIPVWHFKGSDLQWQG